MNLENKYKKQELETLDSFLLRLAALKEKDKSITWQAIADSLVTEFGIYRSERWVRRRVAAEEVSTKFPAAVSSDELEDKLLALKKERVKLAEERAQNNVYVRKLAREETIKDIALAAVKEISARKIIAEPSFLVNKNANSKVEGILCISDWHYGIDVKNYWNTYNIEIAKERIKMLRDKTLEYVQKDHMKKLHVVNLGDLIAGRIHLSLRLESRFDVITQIMQISEILAEFLADLATYTEVEYYSVLDNHSRLEPNKSDSLELESLCRITDWYLKERVGDFIHINDNTYGEDILSFNTLGHTVIGVHAHLDPKTKLGNLALMTKQNPDLMLTAHLHHFWVDELNEVKIIGNGSLMGTDAYAKQLRLSAEPSQNLILVTEQQACAAIYNIVV